MANMADNYKAMWYYFQGYLGKNVRALLPPCAVTEIREAFPSEEYQGFKKTEEMSMI